MHRRILGGAALALAIAASIAWVKLNVPLHVQPASALAVAGTSTVKSFECKAKTMDATVETITADAIGSLLAGEKGIGGVTFTVASAQLDCGNGTMNGHMLKALKAKEFATISFALASYELAKRADTTTVQMRGTLTLSGAQKEITLDAVAAPGPDSSLRVTGVYTLNMKDYGIKPPTLMLGALRVGEKVNVKFDLLLKP